MRCVLLASIVLAGISLLGCGSSERQQATDVSPSSASSFAFTDSSVDSETDAPSAVDSGSGDVGYYNPKTGHSADYTLDIERDSDGTVDRITFPNGGWEDDFVSQEDNGDGTVTVTDEDGREFTVEGGSGSDD